MLDQLSFQQKIEKWYPEICSNIYCGASIPTEWEDIVVDALEELRAYPISIVQIKSKFGGLRIYYDAYEAVLSGKCKSDEFYEYCDEIIYKAVCKAHRVHP